MVVQGVVLERENDEAGEESELDPAFAALEQEFRKTLAQMQRRQGMMTFSNEFKRVLDLLVESHVHRLRFEAMCKELTARVALDSERAQIVAQQALQDQLALQQQKQEVEAAWRQLDASHAREQELQELVDDLRRQVSKLSTDLEQKSRLGLDQGDDFGVLAKTREGLAKEREKLSQEVVTLKDRLARAAVTRAELEQQLNASEQRLQDLAQEMEMHNNELSKETRLKEKLQDEVRTLLQDLEQRTADAAHLSFQLAQSNKTVHRGELALSAQKVANERLMKENETLGTKLGRAQGELEAQAVALDKAMQDTSRKNSELRAREDELSKMRTELTRVSKARDAAEKRARQEEAWRLDHRLERERLRASLAVLERSSEAADKQQRAQKVELERVARDKALLERQLLGLRVELSEKQRALEAADQAAADLRLEARKCEEELDSRKAERELLENARNKSVTQVTELTQQLKRLKKSVFHLQLLLASGKKRLLEADEQLAAQRKENDAMRLENNSLGKVLSLAKDDASELTDKLQNTHRDVIQLKEEVASREFMLFKSRSELQRSERERDSLRMQVQGLQLQVDTQRSSLSAARAAEEELRRATRAQEAERQAAARLLAQARNDRDLLAAQLVRRTAEARLLHQKMRLLQDGLQAGKESYARRVHDMRLLKVEIRRLRLEKNNLASMIRNSSELRLELYQTTRQLTHVQVKCRALEEELQTPLNVHRWRKLEGTDPPQFELVMKVQLLQRRLLSVSAQLLVREAQLREAEQRCSQLQQELARLVAASAPGDALSPRSSQRLLSERARRIKCLASEVRMHETRAEAHLVEQQKAREELAELKQKYFQTKKREQQLRAVHSACQVSSLTLSQLLGRARVLGGGYSLALQPPREMEMEAAD